VHAGYALAAVDCAVSEWGAWSKCGAAGDSGAETGKRRSRTVAAETMNGGQACPSLAEDAECSFFEGVFGFLF
jgi:hypothetical protein